MYNPSLCLPGVPRSDDTSVTISTHCAQFLFLNTIILTINQKPLREMMIPGLMQGKYKQTPEYLIVPETKKILKETWRYIKRSQEQIEGFSNGQIWDNFNDQRKNATWVRWSLSYAPSIMDKVWLETGRWRAFWRRGRQNKKIKLIKWWH